MVLFLCRRVSKAGIHLGIPPQFGGFRTLENENHRVIYREEFVSVIGHAENTFSGTHFYSTSDVIGVHVPYFSQTVTLGSLF